MKIATLCIAALALLQVGLVCNITFLRTRYQLFLGAPDDPDHPLFRARLAHANAAEYGPMLCVLMLCLEGYGYGRQTSMFMPALYLLAMVSRYSHAAGLIAYSPQRPNFFRLAGMAGTLLSLAGMAGLLFYHASPQLVR